MGFASSFVTESKGILVPEWFLEKWGRDVHVAFDNEGRRAFPISSARATKRFRYDDLEEDLERIVREHYASRPEEVNEALAPALVLVWLHECEGVTRTEIEHDGSIRRGIPERWAEVEGGGYGHLDCYGCSDLGVVLERQEKRDRAAELARGRSEFKLDGIVRYFGEPSARLKIEAEGAPTDGGPHRLVVGSSPTRKIEAEEVALLEPFFRHLDLEELLTKVLEIAEANPGKRLLLEPTPVEFTPNFLTQTFTQRMRMRVHVLEDERPGWVVPLLKASGLAEDLVRVELEERARERGDEEKK